MKATGARIAGEMSGHIFLGDEFYGFDDAVYAGGRLLRLVAAGDQPLSALLDALPPSVTTPEIRVACDDAAKFDVVARAAAYFRSQWPVLDVDGVRIEFEGGWGLVRASNTQPVLVLRFEASTPEALAEYRARVEGWLAAHAPEVRLDAQVGH
jgi:phosphomannomutase/phosphoglucomutase